MKNEQPFFAPEMEGQSDIVREQKNSLNSSEKSKEKIDLKKLIIYSEILKPKF